MANQDGLARLFRRIENSTTAIGAVATDVAQLNGLSETNAENTRLLKAEIAKLRL